MVIAVLLLPLFSAWFIPYRLKALLHWKKA